MSMMARVHAAGRPSEPIAHRAGPAVVKASVMPPCTNGHSSSEYPKKNISSQTMICASSRVATWPASTRSRRRWSVDPGR